MTAGGGVGEVAERKLVSGSCRTGWFERLDADSLVGVTVRTIASLFTSQATVLSLMLDMQREEK